MRLRDFWFVIVPMACGIGAVVACHSEPTPNEVSGHARNAAISAAHGAELNACFQKAHDTDAGNQYAIYEACAIGVDTRYGKKP